ncbi:hypothetical protein ABBQ32_003520 [Trebouxia sp. C0010 RCD-2024]
MPNYDPMGTTRRSRGCCYCCCGTKRRTVSCLLCMAVFTATIVLVCYFFIPRKPTFCVTVGYPDEFSASAQGFNVTIPLNVSVANPNYYGFSLDQVTVNLVYKVRGTIDSATTTDTTLSTVTAPDIHIRARGNSTNGFKVVMQNSADTAAANTQILQDCTPSGTTKLYINAAVTLLKRIHITIPNQEVKIQCATVSAVGAATLLPGLANSNGTLGNAYCKKASW